MTDQAAFLNRIRSLYCIDYGRLPELTAEQWERFQQNPPRYLIGADDKQAAAIWREVERRQR